MTMNTSNTTYCGECGTQLANGAGFCGECGTPVKSAAEITEAGSEWAPPARSNTPRQARSPVRTAFVPAPVTTAARTCPNCNATIRPRQAFCRICGANLAGGAPAARPKVPPLRSLAAPAAHAARRAPAAAAAPSAVKRVASKGLLSVVVPAASFIVTYFITRSAVASMFGGEFGTLMTRLIPVVVSGAVGGLARKLVT